MYYCCSVFLKRTDCYKAHRSEKRGVLWLASYPVRCDWPNTSSVKRKCYRIVMPMRDETKTIKPNINEAFVASTGDIITDYNNLYCVSTHYHVCICVRRNDKQQALLYTAQESILEIWKHAYSQLVKLELLHFIETVFEHSWCCRITLLFQVQDSVLCEMRSNICVELFRNNVVHITEPLISSCVLFWKHKRSRFSFMTKQQYYRQNNSSAFFPCVYIWAELCKSPHIVM